MPVDDFSNDIFTTGVLTVDGLPSSGQFHESFDRDWFSEQLIAGQAYAINLSASNTGGGTTEEINLGGIYQSDGFSLSGSFLFPNFGQDPSTIFIPDVTGTYFIEANTSFSVNPNGTNTYSVSVSTTSVVDDFSDDIFTSAFVSTSPLAPSFVGRIDHLSDRDWVRMSLESGKTYEIRSTDVNGFGRASDTLFHANGFTLFVDYVFFGEDTRAVFTPSVTQDYFLAINGSADDVGEYTVAVNEIPPLVEGVSLFDVNGILIGTYVQIFDAMNDAFDGETIDISSSYSGGNEFIEVIRDDLTVVVSSGSQEPFFFIEDNTISSFVLAGDGDAVVDIDFQKTTSTVVIGNDGVNEIFGSEFADDVLVGGGGDDTIGGLDGADVLIGDAGNDRIFGNSGGDLADGGTGDDAIFGDQGDDTLVGGDGDDELSGGEGADNVTGDAGDDSVAGNEGDDTLSGGDGNDYLFGDDGADRLLAGAGGAQLVGDGGSDNLNGGDGDDLLFAGADNDVLDGGLGDDEMFGNEGDDVLVGGLGADFMDGGAGNDWVLYTNSAAAIQLDLARGLSSGSDAASDAFGDTLLGFEYVSGSAFDDRIDGGSEANILVGNDGNDVLYGLGGDDTITGNDGNDVLGGMTGSDLLFGGAGFDTFVIGTGYGLDIIGDFVQGQDILASFDPNVSNVTQLNAFADQGNLVVQYGAGDVVVLVGQANLALTTADFQFFT